MHILKAIDLEILAPLLITLNKYINEGVFPGLLKKAKVLQLFKKGDNNNKENYRPILVLPPLSKIFEAVIKDRIFDFLKSTLSANIGMDMQKVDLPLPH